MQIAEYRRCAHMRVKVAELVSERGALINALVKHEGEFFEKWPGGLYPVSTGSEPSFIAEIDVVRAEGTISADLYISSRKRLEALRSRQIEVETLLREAQVGLLRAEDRISVHESLLKATIKAGQVLPLFLVSVGILMLSLVFDAWDKGQKLLGSSNAVGEVSAPPAMGASVASAPAATPPRLSRSQELHQRESKDSEARVHCLDKLIHDPGAVLMPGCGQAAVAISIRSPRGVPADSRSTSVTHQEVASEWRFPSALELRQSALLESTLESLDKHEERSSLQKTWAAISVPLQLVSVFGALVAIALLIAELARGAGFQWNPEEFVRSRLAPAKDGDGAAAKSLPGTSAGPVLMALLGSLPLLLMVALAAMTVGWSSWRALAPPDLSQVIPIANRIVVQPPALSQAASAPINVTVSARQIDDNLEKLQRQLALLTQAGEQSERSAKASVVWLDKVQQGADSSIAVFGQAASAAQSLGKANQEIQAAASAAQKSAEVIGKEAAQAARFYTDAAKKMDENAVAAANRARDDETRLQLTQKYMLEFAKYMKENKWERSREP